jgi:hypothetical protein
MIRFLGIKVTFNIIESLGIGYVSKAEVNDCRASVCSRELFLNQFVLKTYSKIAVTQISSSQGGFVPTTGPHAHESGYSGSAHCQTAGST